MFKLNEYVDEKKLEKLSERYKGADPLSLRACFLLLRSGSRVLGEIEAIARNYSLNQSRFLILEMLNQSATKSLTVSEITDKLDISRATTSILLDSLDNEGLTRRAVHGEDRRKVVVELQPKGVELMEEILPKVYAKIGQTIGCLTAGEREELIKVLDKVNASLGD
jgi:DNA-binding MarR family transcriptional regulator